MPAATYHIVHCALHDSDKPGYVVCNHVLNGAEIRHHLQPTAERHGEILCQLPHTGADLDWICPDCAMVAFKGRLPQ